MNPQVYATELIKHEAERMEREAAEAQGRARRMEYDAAEQRRVAEVYADTAAELRRWLQKVEVEA